MRRNILAGLGLPVDSCLGYLARSKAGRKCGCNKHKKYLYSVGRSEGRDNQGRPKKVPVFQHLALHRNRPSIFEG